MTTEAQVMSAVLAVLNTGDPDTTAIAFDLDEIKKATNQPTRYTEVTVTRRYDIDGERLDVTTGTDAFRITTRQVAQSVVDNARELRRRTRANLEYASLDVAGLTSTPVKYESGDPIGEDGDAGGFYSGLETWTCTF